ncbi:MAG: plastocyanin/azurin family copper-binding protein [candidate division Zixibacteria bacterium]|jgi:hypothetical protein|nr:plastocyanin/azurin family copper-binding protein [candidate division Zixibacteria bacterium]
MKTLHYLMIGLAIGGGFGEFAVARAATVVGRIIRSAVVESGDRPVERYRGRVSGGDPAAIADCRCDPGHYAVVYLTGDSLPPVRPVAGGRMTQKDMMFQPSVMAVTVGSTVEFPNLDPFYHNVFSYSTTRKFDLGRYAQGKSKSVTFDKPGLVKIFCEIHYSMRAYLHVLTTPYFAVSSESGEFRITGVTPGDYRLHVWQENQPERELTLSVTTDTVTVEID